jgi:hypothetical protein
MKMNKKKRVIVIIPIILVTLLAAYFLMSRYHMDEGMDTIKEDEPPPFAVEDMDMVYLYTDNQGVAHFSEQPPVGYDYEVVYVPRQTSAQKSDHLKMVLAEKAKRIMRGEKTEINKSNIKKTAPDGPKPLPRTTAGDILSRSNELRQQEENQGNK